MKHTHRCLGCGKFMERGLAGVANHTCRTVPLKPLTVEDLDNIFSDMQKRKYKEPEIQLPPITDKQMLKDLWGVWNCENVVIVGSSQGISEMQRLIKELENEG